MFSAVDSNFLCITAGVHVDSPNITKRAETDEIRRERERSAVTMAMHRELLTEHKFMGSCTLVAAQDLYKFAGVTQNMLLSRDVYDIRPTTRPHQVDIVIDLAKFNRERKEFRQVMAGVMSVLSLVFRDFDLTDAQVIEHVPRAASSSSGSDGSFDGFDFKYLKTYQKNVLRWMAMRERECMSTSRFVCVSDLILAHSRSFAHRVYFDVDTYKLYSMSPDEQLAYYDDELNDIVRAEIRDPAAADDSRSVRHALGGIVADEMGLGKTVVCAAYVSFVLDRLRANGSFVLVLCPSGVARHWRDEIVKFDSSVRVEMIVRKNKMLTSKTARSVDVVIVTHSLYRRLADFVDDGDDDADAINIESVIVDEFHELVLKQKTRAGTWGECNDKVVRAIHAIPRKTTWLVSGTPLLGRTHRIVEHLFGFRDMFSAMPVWTHANEFETVRDKFCEMNLNPSIHHWRHDLIYRNTKESIQKYDERIAQCDVEVRFITLTSAEWHIMLSKRNTLDRNEMLLYCSIPHYTADAQISDGHTVSDTLDLQIDRLEKKVSTCRARIAASNGSCGSSSSPSVAVVIVGDSSQKDTAAKDAKDAKNKAARDKAAMDRLRKYEFLLKAFRSIRNNKIECPICLDEKDVGVVSECGHSICAECHRLMATGPSRRRCPVCRKNAPEYFATSCVDVTAVESDLVNRYGSKIAAVVETCVRLKEDPEARMILFAFNDIVLRETAKVLNDHGVRCSRYINSVGHGDNIVAKFNDGLIDAIMMSSDKYVSGVNLEMATHIIFIDQLHRDNMSDVHALEQQAIGRALRMGRESNVKMIRFVTRNTIEECMYDSLRNHYAQSETIASVVEVDQADAAAA